MRGGESLQVLKCYWDAEKEVLTLTGGIRGGFTEKLRFVLGLEGGARLVWEGVIPVAGTTEAKTHRH